MGEFDLGGVGPLHLLLQAFLLRMQPDFQLCDLSSQRLGIQDRRKFCWSISSLLQFLNLGLEPGDLLAQKMYLPAEARILKCQFVRLLGIRVFE